jgi:hypothetical protein
MDVGVYVSGAGLDCILSRCEAVIFGGVDAEKGMERIIVVILLDAVAVEAFYIKQTSVEELELLSRVVRALREACDRWSVRV